MSRYTLIIIGILAVAVLATAAVIGISIRPNAESTPMLTTLMGFLTMIVVNLFQLAKVKELNGKVEKQEKKIRDLEADE